MPNHGSKYGERVDRPATPVTLEKGAIMEFAEAYKRFWEKRGIDITDHKDELPKENWKLSDPIQGDPVRLSKAIAYGRSYRKDKDGTNT